MYLKVINFTLRRCYERRKYIFSRKYKLAVSRTVNGWKVSEDNSQTKECLTERLQ